MRSPTGAMMNTVRNSVRPIRIWFDGISCVPIACRRKWKTIDDARERRHDHERPPAGTTAASGRHDLQRRRDRADAVHLQIELTRGRWRCAGGAWSVAVPMTRHTRDAGAARGARGTSSRLPARLSMEFGAERTGGRRDSSVTSDTVEGASPSSSRRPSTATMTSDRRSPSGIAVSTATDAERAGQADERRRA